MILDTIRAHKVLQNPRLRVWMSGQGPKVDPVAEK